MELFIMRKVSPCRRCGVLRAQGSVKWLAAERPHSTLTPLPFLVCLDLKSKRRQNISLVWNARKQLGLEHGGPALL